MSKRSISKADKARADKLRELGCIVCLLEFGEVTPSAIHHIDGQTKKNCHKLTIPLCPNHHQIKDNFSEPRWISRHGDGRAAFEGRYGTEQYLLDETNRLINET